MSKFQKTQLGGFFNSLLKGAPKGPALFWLAVLGAGVAVSFQNCSPASFVSEEPLIGGKLDAGNFEGDPGVLNPEDSSSSQMSSCVIQGQELAHGSSIDAFLQSEVPAGQACISETRTCANGSLSGSFSFVSCSAMPASNVDSGTNSPGSGTQASNPMPTEGSTNSETQPGSSSSSSSENQTVVMTPGSGSGSSSAPGAQVPAAEVVICESSGLMAGGFTSDQSVVASSQGGHEEGEWIAIGEASDQNHSFVKTLQNSSTAQELNFHHAKVRQWLTAHAESCAFEVLKVQMASGGVLKLAPDTLLINQDGKAMVARDFKVGDSLIRSDASQDAIASIVKEMHSGKLHHVRVNSASAGHNVILVNGYLAATGVNLGTDPKDKATLNKLTSKGALKAKN